MLVLLAALLLHLHAARSGWSVGPAVLRGDDTLAVTLVNRGRPVRVAGVELRDDDLAVVAPGALTDEVAAAQARGVPPAHDGGRPLGRGRHTFLLGIRPRCPRVAGAAVDAAVLLVVVDGPARRTTASALPQGPVGRLLCTPLTVAAGLAPTPPPAGEVDLLLTAHVTSAAGARTLRGLAWPGFVVDGVGNVVPLALSQAGIDETVFFGAAVRPDCGTAVAGGLQAVFADGVLPVRLTPVAGRRVQALRAACR